MLKYLSKEGLVDSGAKIMILRGELFKKVATVDKLKINCH